VKHPNHEEISAFAFGNLSEEPAQAIATHITECSECEETLQELETKHDDVIGRLRNAPIDDRYTTEFVDQTLGEEIEKVIGALASSGSSSEEDELRELDSIRDYQLLAKLGQGGMGTVYKARHVELDRIVAIKVLPSQRLQDPATVTRFKREWKAAAKLNHVNIVQAYDAGEHEATYFLAMEYVDGFNLASLVQELGPLPIADACELIRQAAVGLQHAHEHGLVHRDVKPANLMLATSPSTRTPEHADKATVKVLDLGLARLFSAEDADLTSTQQIMGTVDYMAPEQARDSHQVDIRADVYSLGASLYKLLCGQAPYQGPQFQTVVAKLTAIANERVPAIQQRREDLPKQLVRTLDRMLAKSEADRFATPSEVAKALAPFCDEADLSRLAARYESYGSDSTTEDHIAIARRAATQPDVQSRPQIAVKRRSQRVRNWIVGIAASLILLLCGAVVVVQTQFGELEIETVADDVRVIVDRDGGRVRIIDLETGKKIRLWPGEYGLRIDGRDDLTLESATMVLKRGEEKIARIVWKATVEPPSDPTDDGGITLTGEGWSLVCGVTWEEFQAWLDSLSKERFRIIHLNGHYHLGAARFAAIAVEVPRAPPWEVHHTSGFADDQTDFDTMCNRGYYPAALCGYSDGSTFERIELFEKRIGTAPNFSLWSSLTEDEFRRKFFDYRESGLHPVETCAFSFQDSIRIAARFEPSQGHTHSRHFLTSQGYDSILKEAVRLKYRPISVAVCSDADEIRLGVVLRKDDHVYSWLARHNLSLEQYRDTTKQFAGEGYRPDRLVAYSEASKRKYAAIWIRPRDSVVELPRTGELPAQLSAFDAAVEKFMLERAIPAGSLAIIKDTELVASRGYGFKDRLRKTPTPVGTPFRIASLSKRFTAASIHKLISQGKLTLDSKVMPILGSKGEFDAGWNDITVGHLLAHQGGWDANQDIDPLFSADAIAASERLTLPLTSRDLLEYMSTRPLQFRPGTETVYSNFGYVVLGLLIEKTSGRPCVEYLQDEVLATLDLATIQQGKTLVRARLSDEPYYLDPYFGSNVVESGSTEAVSRPDGTFALEVATASSGLVGSATDVARFVLHYNINGEPVDGLRQNVQFGQMPGSFTMVITRPDGVVIVALFNQGHDSTGLDYKELHNLLNEAADSVTDWPDPNQ
jgi:serine/threonine protein kinase/CubicO group peptidase (beta-lactamase class C family)